MWPGQQPPGGEQNPQDQNPNPYQQPGYQQPNPYQQPGYQQPGYPPQQPGQEQPGYQQQPGYPQQGYQQPNPYQQPTVPQYAVPGQPGPSGPGPDKKKNTTVIAVVAAAVVVIAAAGTAFFVMGGDDKKSDKAADDAKASSSASPPEEPSAAPSADNPRDGSAAEPTIEGWKVVTNPKHGTQFDVPADWEVSKPGVISGFEDVKKGDGSPAITFSAPAFYKSKWCSQDTDKDGKMEDSSLGGTGTKGGRGAKDTASAAQNEAGSWVWAAYAQEEPEASLKEKVNVSKSEAFTTTTGLKGHFATAATTGLTKKNKCDTDGKSIAFTFANAKGDFSTWVLYANKGVPDEIPDETIKKIMSTVRLAGTS
ncbi:hypothetical protein OIE62_08360 [Streptomyces scopuliridis]|uniref:Uncharacterized protein n=1 Tax=Streptomyces scopuliridis TaxID=452529 RepID=A0ACD4ZT09_9ACTN|nr:hypothetical protein [Streptomyces scopuliridis]WSC01428.1 hypothetical protein OG835_33460 [Streptomyces scopuliridis]WSC05035.1 hypothetical protein OIE62_08360 [Streptomyces scopuliridis]